MVEAGITQVRLPDVVQKQAVAKVLAKVDDGNKVPRAYRKRIDMPSIVNNQIKLLIDDYVDELNTPRTFNEFKTNRDEFITKLYYTCKQGE